MQTTRLNTELFTQLAAGDEQAYRSLFHYYTPRLHPFILSIVKSEAATEEIVQDVMLKLWLNRQEITQKDNPSSWVFTVASNQAISFLRRMSLERKYIDKAKAQMEQAREQNPTEDRLVFRERESLLKQAVDQLPSQQQLVYKMSRLEGFTYKEISEKLNISPNTVKNHIVTAAKTIMAFLQKSSLIFFYFFL